MTLRLTRWCEVRFLRNKSDVFKATVEYLKLVEKQLGKSVKCLQSDNGTEYTNKELDEYLKQKGISRRLTVPITLNRMAFRRGRTGPS
jgi:transposase InsO family protein